MSKKVWSDDEEQVLTMLYGKKSLYELSHILRKSKTQISWKITELKLTGRKYPQGRTHWTKKEDEIIVRCYQSHGRKILSEILNRTIYAIDKRASILISRMKNGNSKS